MLHNIENLHELIYMCYLDLCISFLTVVNLLGICLVMINKKKI